MKFIDCLNSPICPIQINNVIETYNNELNNAILNKDNIDCIINTLIKINYVFDNILNITNIIFKITSPNTKKYASWNELIQKLTIFYKDIKDNKELYKIIENIYNTTSDQNITSALNSFISFFKINIDINQNNKQNNETLDKIHLNINEIKKELDKKYAIIETSEFTTNKIKTRFTESEYQFILNYTYNKSININFYDYKKIINTIKNPTLKNVIVNRYISKSNIIMNIIYIIIV